jgi:glycosyltransferase involved in cell wall biosynthesis
VTTLAGRALISVVVPTFNRAGLVCEALDSVAAQTWRPIELIVVDDGSTDDTQQAIIRWQQRNQADDLSLTYLRQSNQGQNAARNAGIAAARGEYVAFLDSDDLYLPSKLEKQIELLSLHPDWGAVYCGIVDVDLRDGTRRVQRHPFPQGRLFERLLVRDVTNPTSTYLIRRTAIEQVGGLCREIDGRTDWEMTLRIARNYPIGAVPEPLIEFRAHAGPRTMADRNREIGGYRYIRQKYRAEIAALPLRQRLASRSAYYRRMGRVQFHGGLSWPKALAYYLAALANGPDDFDNYAALAGLFLPRSLRAALHDRWNRLFGGTALAIRSH